MVAAVGLPSLASGLFLPLTLVYFTVLTEISLPVLGLITSAAVVITVPIPLAGGWLVDRWGATRVVTLALLIQAIGFAGFTVARGTGAVFAVSAIMACGNRLYWSSIFAAIATHADSSAGRTPEWWFARGQREQNRRHHPRRRRYRRAHHHRVGFGLRWRRRGCGGATDRGCRGTAPPAAPDCVSAPHAVSPAAEAPPTPTSLSGLGAALRDRAFVGYTLLNAIFALAVLFLGLALPTTMRSGLGGPGWLTAVFLTANALLVAVLGLRAARWAERRPRARALAVSGSLWAVAYSVIAIAVELPLWAAVAPLAIAVCGIATAEAIQAPASMAWASESAPLDARGRYLAVFQYSWLIAEIAGPVLFAVLFAHGAWLPFALVAVANALAVLALPAVSRRLGSR